MAWALMCELVELVDPETVRQPKLRPGWIGNASPSEPTDGG